MNSISPPRFRVLLTADFYDSYGEPRYQNFGLQEFDGHSHFEVSPFAEHSPEISAEQLRDAHAVLVLTPRVTASSLLACPDLLAVSRFGVGYDSVDVAACTARDVLVLITAGAVDRSVAEATIGWMLALSHRMLTKDRLVRCGDWEARSQYMGSELRDRTLGVIGLGGIGRKLVQLLDGFGMQPPIAYDPGIPATLFHELGVRSVELDELLATADYVSLHCPLNPHTHGLIGKAELKRMKSTAYLLNLARGGVVDEDALEDALRGGWIAGAALDCFATEPVLAPHRLRDLENVILAPHSIAWTNEMFRDIGQMACEGIVRLSQGEIPRGIVNPQVLDSPGFQDKWRRVRSAVAAATRLKTS